MKLSTHFQPSPTLFNSLQCTLSPYTVHKNRLREKRGKNDTLVQSSSLTSNTSPIALLSFLSECGKLILLSCRNTSDNFGVYEESKCAVIKDSTRDGEDLEKNDEDTSTITTSIARVLDKDTGLRTLCHSANDSVLFTCDEQGCISVYSIEWEGNSQINFRFKNRLSLGQIERTPWAATPASCCSCSNVIIIDDNNNEERKTMVFLAVGSISGVHMFIYSASNNSTNYSLGKVMVLPLTGSQANVSAVSLSTNAKTLLTISLDGGIYLWNIHYNTEVDNGKDCIDTISIEKAWSSRVQKYALSVTGVDGSTSAMRSRITDISFLYDKNNTEVIAFAIASWDGAVLCFSKERHNQWTPIIPLCSSDGQVPLFPLLPFNYLSDDSYVICNDDTISLSSLWSQSFLKKSVQCEKHPHKERVRIGCGTYVSWICNPSFEKYKDTFVLLVSRQRENNSNSMTSYAFKRGDGLDHDNLATLQRELIVLSSRYSSNNSDYFRGIQSVNCSETTIFFGIDKQGTLSTIISV